MIERIVVMLAVYIPMLAYDRARLRKSERKEKIAYALLLLVSLYLGIDYVTESHWPNINELLDLTLTKPARRIVEAVKLAG